MCKLVPLKSSDLLYYKNLGLRDNVKKEYGDEILKYFNEYLNAHPDYVLRGEHPVGIEDDTEETESLYFPNSSSKSGNGGGGSGHWISRKKNKNNKRKNENNNSSGNSSGNSGGVGGVGGGGGKRAKSNKEGYVS